MAKKEKKTIAVLAIAIGAFVLLNKKKKANQITHDNYNTPVIGNYTDHARKI